MRMKLIGQMHVLVVEMEEELDHHIAQNVREIIDKELKRTNAINLVFDFRNLSFMDSSGIGVIIGRYKIVKILGGSVIIVSPQPQVRRIIEMAGIHKIIKITNTLDNALKMV
ncbi:MAG: anti-sigma F factor antagonist [Clostridia bacterium]|nr:anti-sigma F factor antagonist [Clostridia bacterium]